MLRIALGSTNPVKISATEKVFRSIYGDDIEVIPVQVDSGVSHTPLSEEETIKGAINRAIKAIKEINADIGVGMEGGVAKKLDRYFLTGWCAVVDRDDVLSLASSVYLELPQKIVEAVMEGRELGDVMDEYTGKKDIKKKEGAIGVLTNNFMTREAAWKSALIYALARRLNPSAYRF